MKIPDELLFLRRRELPAFVSAEAAECGLACLAMIGAYHGHAIDLNGMRQRFAISMSGMSLKGMIGLADEIGLASRALRVEMSDLSEIQTPAILHWDLNHYVVLKSVTSKKAIIHDPAKGRCELTLAQLSLSFTGVVLELAPAVTFEPMQAKAQLALGDLWSKSRGLTNAVGVGLALSAALQVLTFAAPFQMQLVIDQSLARNDPDLLVLIALVFGALVALQALTSAVRDYSLMLFGNQFMLQMVGNIVRHLIRLPASYFEKRHVGDILSRVSATQPIQDALSQGAIAVLIDGAMSLVAGLVLFLYSPKLAVIVLISILAVLVLNVAFFPAMRERSQDMILASATEQTYLMETIRAISTIKLMGGEPTREANWKNLYVAMLNATVSGQRLGQVYSGLTSLVIGVQTVSIIYFGARDILSAQGMSLGMLTAFLAFRQTFTDRGLSLVAQFGKFRMLGLQLERIGDIVSQDREVGSDDPTYIDVSGSIALEQLSFRYGATDRWILKDVDLTINQGDFIALVGPSGGGKTTFVRIVLGLQSPTEGKVLLDERAASPAVWRAWRSKVGVVLQSDHLFSGSLAENISFFDPDMDMAAVAEAAVKARLHDEINAMPMRYNTYVGDMGSSLSGGQRQRLLLARALYRKPKMLILDEGTANLDAENEAAIAELLSALAITKIVVAHRPALVERANRVLHVEAGHVREISASTARQISQASRDLGVSVDG